MKTALHSWLARKLVFPLHDSLTGQNTWAHWQNLRKRQWDSVEQNEARALTRIRELIGLAWHQVPHYQDAMHNIGITPRDIKSLGDLALLPPLLPDQVRQHYHGRLLAQNIPDSRRVEGTTSGSSAAPLNFYKDRQFLGQIRSGLLFFREWAGIEPSAAQIWIAHPRHITYNRQVSPGQRMARSFLLGETIRELNGADLNLPELSEVVKSLPAKQRYFILGYPSYLEKLARQIEQNPNKLSRNPFIIVCYAETLIPPIAELISRAFGAPVHNLYSANEVLFMAQTCPDHPDLLHINPCRAWLRVVDEQGKDSPIGVTGRVCVTDLCNEVTPLINYQLGDLAQRGPVCPCGRGFPTLIKVEGRESSLIHTLEGRTLAPATLFVELFKPQNLVRHIKEFQAIQHTPNRISLLIVPTNGFSPEIKNQARQTLEHVLGRGMEVEIRVVPSIEPEPSGKRLWIKQLAFQEPGIRQ